MIIGIATFNEAEGGQEKSIYLFSCPPSASLKVAIPIILKYINSLEDGQVLAHTHS